MIFVVAVVALMIWVEDWASSGKMDAFIEQHEHPKMTPRLIFFIGEACHTAQSAGNASRYFEWVIQKYPNKSFIPKARFHLAMSYEELGDRRKAMEQYIVLKDSYTHTSYGRTAMRKWELSRY